jgi:putative ATP-dependent endonuclease of OLD family
MHISKLSIINYRNFANAKVIFKKGTNTIIGENGSGKTNLFRAIRLLLDSNMSRSATRLTEQDFHRGLANWKGHWIIISLEFEEISQDEVIQSLFLHGTGNVGDGVIEKATFNLIFRPKNSVRHKLSQLEAGDQAGLSAIRDAITLDDYETIFTGRSEADFNDPAVYQEIVGDFENANCSEELENPSIGAKVPGIFSITSEISFTYIQALRDVVSDFQNNRTNPLLTLLKRKSGDIDPAIFQPIAEKVKELNDSIEGLNDVQAVRTDIKSTIKDAAGVTYSPTSLSIKSDLPDEADKLFQSLKLFIGESSGDYEGGIHELSLGGANLIYLSLKLLEFKYQKAHQSFANFLLIEEPEAHIHTHIQKTLFNKLNYGDAQIIYSTHSTHISEVSNVQSVNILARRGVDCEVFQPTTGLTPQDIGTIQRYLDAVRSNLLFAKSVILIEGDAEEILIPVMVKMVFGVSLDELGVSLINIRSTGFQNVGILFHSTRIKKKCAIVTDLDAAFIDTAPNAADTEPVKKYKARCKASADSGAARKVILDAFQAGNDYIGTFYASNTFEVDFITAGNANHIAATIPLVYVAVTTAAPAKIEIESRNIALYGRRVLTMANNQGKGWFALLIASHIDWKTKIPLYILSALKFVYPNISKEIWLNIFAYRLGLLEASNQFPSADIEAMKASVNAFATDNLTFQDLRAQTRAKFPADSLNLFLQIL